MQLQRWGQSRVTKEGSEVVRHLNVLTLAPPFEKRSRHIEESIEELAAVRIYKCSG